MIPFSTGWSDSLLDSHTILETFERVAGTYDQHAALEQEVCRRLLERCEFQRQPPKRILDLGCGTGEGCRSLKRKFRQAQVIGLDFSPAMLARMSRRSSLLRPLNPVCADLTRLPFAQQSVDLMFSNLAMNWSSNPALLFDEIRRVLRPGGMLLFTMLGPGTLAECCEAWAAIDALVAGPVLPDLMQVGDALIAGGFTEPVMDMERITLRYPSLAALINELESTGASLLIRGWENGKGQRQRLDKAFQSLLVDGKLPVTYEVLYGTAFGPPEG